MHYKESHHVCQECETTGRMTCFASRDQLGLHRMHEHPQESQSDPDRWEPLQMHFSTQGLISQYGRMRRGRQAGDDAQAEDGGLSASLSLGFLMDFTCFYLHLSLCRNQHGALPSPAT